MEDNLGIFSIMREEPTKHYCNWKGYCNGGHLRCTTREDLVFKATLMFPNLHMIISENTILLNSSTFMVLDEAEINVVGKNELIWKQTLYSQYIFFGCSVPPLQHP